MINNGDLKIQNLEKYYLFNVQTMIVDPNLLVNGVCMGVQVIYKMTERQMQEFIKQNSKYRYQQ